MPQPTIGVFIPTAGRKSIARTLHSILTQRLIPGDDILVIGDGFRDDTQKTIESLGPPFRYLFTEKTSDWGHSQCNYGMSQLRSDICVAQDDDDIFAPRAFEVIREAAIEFPNKPFMARVKTPVSIAKGGWGILWKKPGVPPFDGHCLVYPNNPKKLGRWGSAYDGDQDYMRTTFDHYDDVGWLDKIISITRPTWKLWTTPVTLQNIEPLRQIRNSCREFMTRYTHEISSSQQLLWWHNLDYKNNWYWLFDNKGFVGLRRRDIGLRRRDNRMYATYGLLPSERGFGWGKELVEFSQYAAQEELHIEVLESNERAIKLYEKMGFKENWRVAGAIGMSSEWPPKYHDDSII